jgi:hypothetical protein
MKIYFAALLVLFSLSKRVTGQVTAPEITSWIINTTGDTGYDSILTNVQQVWYSANNVYVSATCIPGYDIGPWTGNPNIPANQNFLFKITRNPQANTGNPVATPMGHTGIWSNGVSIFNAKDGFSYNSQGIWNQNAVVVEGMSFDSCLGHPAPNGEYHHHLNPKCLYDDHDSSVHSPIIGYAFDGFPVYGAYGYSNVNGTGNVTRMKTSYRYRSISQRTSLPDGTILNASQYGPAVSSAFPLGYYLEDFEFISGLGDLDEHNGRFCVTPEYPGGIYAYFVTLDDSLAAEYPYTMGPEYYGTVQPGNTGPGSGHVIISEPVTAYIPTSGLMEFNQDIQWQVFPNPAIEYLSFYVLGDPSEIMKVDLINLSGQKMYSVENVYSGIQYTFELGQLKQGVYCLKLSGNQGTNLTKKIIRK